MAAATATFRFNGNYRDFGQVEPFYEEFLAVFAEVERSPGFAYNDDFIDRIPGIANKEKRPNGGTHEDGAIYMLQGLKRLRDTQARVEQLLADGYEFIESVEGTQRFAEVVLTPSGDRGGSLAHYPGARLWGEDGRIIGLLPKGKRTRGYAVEGRRVLVRR